MSIGERIRQRRLEIGLSVDELARRLGKNRATVYRYESDEIENLPLNILEPLAAALRVSPAHIMGWEVETEPSSVPVLAAIEGGTPIFGRDTFQYYAEGDGDVSADFCIRVRDGSMVDPRTEGADLIFVKRQSSVNAGDMAVVALEDRVILGRLYEAGGGTILEPLDRGCRPVFGTGFHVLGRAVMVQSRL